MHGQTVYLVLDCYPKVNSSAFEPFGCGSIATERFSIISNTYELPSDEASRNLAIRCCVDRRWLVASLAPPSATWLTIGGEIRRPLR